MKTKTTLAALVVATLLGACSSSSDTLERSSSYEVPRGRLVVGSENYGGPQTAAVAPVSDRWPGDKSSDARLHADVQRSIQRQLERSNIFAGVVALNSPDESNEAEVIIEPALVGSAGYGVDDVELRVRVTEKTKRRVVLDERYGGNGSRRKPLNVAIQELEQDLESRYEK